MRSRWATKAAKRIQQAGIEPAGPASLQNSAISCCWGVRPPWISAISIACSRRNSGAEGRSSEDERNANGFTLPQCGRANEARAATPREPMVLTGCHRAGLAVCHAELGIAPITAALAGWYPV